MGVSRDKLIRMIHGYVAGEVTRREYREWLIDQVWNADELGDSQIEAMLWELESLDAEYTSGHWSEDHLRAELKARSLSYPVKHSSV